MIPLFKSAIGLLGGLGWTGILLFCASAGWGSPAQTDSKTTAPQASPQEPVTVLKVKDHIYEIKGGSGANSGFFVGKNEVVVIDAKMTEESGNRMIKEIQKITPNPINRILLTHSDRDHVNGLTAFPAGTTIVSHEETRRYMDEAFKGDTLRAFLPDITFASRATVYADTAKIEMIYFGPAHTSGDAVILFPRDKVAFVGDLLTVGRDPLIHLSKNGTSFGLVKVLKAILRLDADVFVSGHSDVAGRAEIEAEIQSVQEKQARVKELVDQKKTLDEVKKAFNVQEGGRWPSLYEVIYREMTEKKASP
jgi:glyoxylase-like metal-dependent hydrolase (beta-lactamase superfamily II)